MNIVLDQSNLYDTYILILMYFEVYNLIARFVFLTTRESPGYEELKGLSTRESQGCQGLKWLVLTGIILVL